MAKMSLGTFTFPHNPSKMTMIKSKRSTSYVETYTNIGFFSWGTIGKGIPIKLEWDFMQSATFASLDALLMADAAVTFNPQDGTGYTYTAEIISLQGDYHVGLGVSPNTHRTNVEMELVIKGKL